LEEAFTSFTDAAASLERSYGLLQKEVGRLRQELEETNRDLARSQAENQELQHEQERLRRKQALADMSAMLAHEVRNPLGSLELFAGLLNGSQLGSEERRWVRQLQAGLRTLSATVNNILQFHGSPEMSFAPVALGSLLDWMGQFLEPQAEAVKVTLQIKHQFHHTLVMGDRHRLEQVLMNLVLNAFRFTAANSTVTISGEPCSIEEESFARILIRDNGPGIDSENRERIFEPGYTTRAGSPGLGLAVCRTIVQQHGGSIAALPCDGGATFEILLPMARNRK
jgi:signal transduction histidine kinase